MCEGQPTQVEWHKANDIRTCHKMRPAGEHSTSGLLKKASAMAEATRGIDGVPLGREESEASGESARWTSRIACVARYGDGDGDCVVALTRA